MGDEQALPQAPQGGNIVTAALETIAQVLGLLLVPGGVFTVLLSRRRRHDREDVGKAESNGDKPQAPPQMPVIGERSFAEQSMRTELDRVNTRDQRRETTHESELAEIRESVATVRREQAQGQAFLLAMTAHVWDWRQRHVAAGSPYTPPVSPTGPPGVTDLLPVWPDPDGA